MPKLYYENISIEDFDKKFDEFETLNDKFEFLKDYLLSYGIDEIDDRENTNVVNLLDNPAENFIHHAREKFLAASLKERDKYNEANIEQLPNEIVNPAEKADSKVQQEMQQFMLQPAKYLSVVAFSRKKALKDTAEVDKDELAKYEANLEFVKRQFYSINKIFDANEKKRHAEEVLRNSKKACQMNMDATVDDVIKHNKGGFFENVFNTTSKEYKEFVKAYKEFNDKDSPKYGNDEELEKATRAYIKHKIPNFNLPNQIPTKEELERFSGTSRGRLEFCTGVLETINQRFQRNLMNTCIQGVEEKANKINQEEFQNTVNKDVEKDNNLGSNEVIENNEIQVENEIKN